MLTVAPLCRTTRAVKTIFNFIFSVALLGSVAREPEPGHVADRLGMKRGLDDEQRLLGGEVHAHVADPLHLAERRLEPRDAGGAVHAADGEDLACHPGEGSLSPRPAADEGSVRFLPLAALLLLLPPASGETGPERRHVIALVEGKTLPIKFRIEQGIIGGVTVSPSSATVPWAETVQLTATVTDLHGEPVDGASVAWSSSDATVATVETKATIVTMLDVTLFAHASLTAFALASTGRKFLPR